MKKENIRVGMIVKRKKNENSINQRYKVLVESVDEDLFSGRIISVSDNCDYRLNSYEEDFDVDYFKISKETFIPKTQKWLLTLEPYNV